MPLNLFRTQSIHSPPFIGQGRSLWTRRGNDQVLKPSDTLRGTLYTLTHPDSREDQRLCLLGSYGLFYQSDTTSFTHQELKRFYLINKSSFIFALVLKAFGTA